ncbi:MAG: hydrogenase nickel incorporation protein HypB [Nitrospinae bacterium]|nr:hydrogenase nickel incorporation protein HypB [Nitrospinota bacterium]
MAEVVEVRKNVLGKNDEIAAANREHLARLSVTALNFVSSPGAGKTSLLVRTLNDLKDEIRFAVIEGDQETDNDARRIAETGVPVTQINTISACHLDAQMVRGAFAEIPLQTVDTLLIENVGNLVCPASYDLGENMKVAVMSVTEGEDKPAKYPKMFRVSSALLITKADLLPHLDFDLPRAVEYARNVNPSLKIFTVSSRTGEGMEDWYGFIRAMRNAGQG